MHGAPRLTIDIDVTVALGEMPIHVLAAALSADRFALRISDDDFVQLRALQSRRL